MVSDLNNFVDNMKNKKPSAFSVEYCVFKYDDHDTVFPTALTQGIKYIYAMK